MRIRKEMPLLFVLAAACSSPLPTVPGPVAPEASSREDAGAQAVASVAADTCGHSSPFGYGCLRENVGCECQYGLLCAHRADDRSSPLTCRVALNNVCSSDSDCGYSYSATCTGSCIRCRYATYEDYRQRKRKCIFGSGYTPPIIAAPVVN